MLAVLLAALESDTDRKNLSRSMRNIMSKWNGQRCAF